MKKIGIILLFICLVSGVWAQDFSDFEMSEEDMFGSEEDVVVEVSEVESEDVTAALESESVTFTGNIRTDFSYGFTQGIFDGDEELLDGKYGAGMSGAFFLDVRLTEGFKAFANISLGQNFKPSSTAYRVKIDAVDKILELPFAIETPLTVKEFFVDTNINKQVYFRLGQQVLQWGRGYFWNPTDLINVEKKNFFDMEANRSGSMGIKAHVPFGTTFNVYGFADFTNVTKLDEIALSIKGEALIGNTEVSLSSRIKYDVLPIFGIDISSRLLDFDIWGEAAFSYGSDATKFDPENPLVPLTFTEDPFFNGCIGLSRSFDFLDESDRIMTVAEFYYNHLGYEENMFEEVGALYKSAFLLGYFDPLSYGKYYLALSVSVNKFILSDMTYSLGCIANFSDTSFALTNSLSYSPVDNFSINFGLNAYLGETLRNFTVSFDPDTMSVISGNRLNASVSMSMNF